MSGFVMVPGWLLAKKPNGNEVLAYCQLASFGTWNPGSAVYDECRPAIATLAERCGMSETNLRRALKGLAEKGALIASGPRYDERGGQLPTVYRVVFGTVSEGVPPAPPPSAAGVTPGMPPAPPNPEPPTKTSSPSVKRGTRCPDDFMPSEKTKEWCRDNLLPEVFNRAGTELIKFRNYWISRTGKGATKLDWDRTFQNWMLTEQDRAPARGPGGQPKPFVQEADLYKARRAEADKLHTAVGQQLIDQGVPREEAAKQADEAKRAYLARDPMESNAGLPYIDGEILDADRLKEVTRS